MASFLPNSCGLLSTTTQAPRHNNPRPSLFHAILYRALKPGGEGSQADALGWTFDRNVLEQLHLCMANAQRNSYRRQAFFESCADTLQSLNIPDDARSTCLECVHTTAVENVLQQDRDQTNALVTASTTENMCRLALPVEKSSFVYKAVASMNLTEVEKKFVLNSTALKPVDDDDAGADDALSDLPWPLISASQLRRSVVENLITKVWVVEFTRKSGDIFSMYSVVVPGTLLEIAKTRLHFSTVLLSIITYLSCSLLFIKLLVPSQKGVTCEAAVHFSTLVCETARRKMVCTEHKNYSSTNVSHVCPHLKAMH